MRKLPYMKMNEVEFVSDGPTRKTRIYLEGATRKWGETHTETDVNYLEFGKNIYYPKEVKVRVIHTDEGTTFGASISIPLEKLKQMIQELEMKG